MVATALMLSAARGGGVVHDLLWMPTFAGAWGVLNLVPLTLTERDGTAGLRSDERLVLDALRAGRPVSPPGR